MMTLAAMIACRNLALLPTRLNDYCDYPHDGRLTIGYSQCPSIPTGRQSVVYTIIKAKTAA
jgi:hypothetical protein